MSITTAAQANNNLAAREYRAYRLESGYARMTWKDDGCLIRSGCGRFTLGVTFRGQATYRLLTDTATGREYPCRTVASAKDLARRLA